MKKIKFEIPGVPVGQTSTTHGSKWTPRYRKYAEYAKYVRRCARAAGLPVPLIATRSRPLKIRTVAYFKNGTHPDPENINKGVADALFYDEEKAALAKMARKSGSSKRFTGKGNDKYTGRSFPPPIYDKDNPRVIVIVSDYIFKKEKVKKCR